MNTSVLLWGLIPVIAGAAELGKPNVIVVSCDNLGYGDTQPFGSTLQRTPHLNRMAKEGRKFTHFYVTAGVCTPSRASLMTGCYAQRVGMHHNERDGWVLRPVSPYGLNPEELTIAELLKTLGYATAIVGKWHLGDQPAFLPTRQGFDWFFGIPYSDDMTEREWSDGSKWPPLPLMENEVVIEAPCDRDALTRRYTERAMQWIADHHHEPFFLYLAHAMPGSTSAPFASADFKGRSHNGPWGDAIEELDWSIGQMLDQLVQLGIADRTLVIWTSDNGAPTTRRPGDFSRGSNLPLHGRGYTTAEGAFRVPTIAWQPGKVPAGTVCDELATTMDLLPTFVRLAGGVPPEDRTIDGRDIAPLLFGEPGAKSPHEVFYYYHQQQLQAVRSGPWKLFLPVEAAGHPHFSSQLPPQTLLFNVVEDMACEHNRAADQPQVVARLMQLADRGRQELGDGPRPGSAQRPPGKIAADARPQPQLLPPSALDVIEGVQGGRHWVDAETDPPKSPQESLAALQIEAGFQVELFAAEPLVKDPVSITFDDRGRMFVAEYGDYPSGPPDGGDPLSKIVMLHDVDGDGAADRRVVFADKLDFAHSLMAFQGGLLVGAKTKILFLQDTDGDEIADVRQTLFDGFEPAHPQMQIGMPCWGIDNWIYLNYGPGKVTSSRDPGRVVEIPRKDFRFHPRTMQFEADSGLGQFGNTIDRWGRRFYCTNRNPIITTFLPPPVLARNPYHVVAKTEYDVGNSGGETRVYPLVEMKSNYLSHAGTHTSACGTTAYLGDLTRGGAAVDDLLSSVMVCEPIGHLVTRSIVEPTGLQLTARRAESKSDFLASTDTWFRPASLASGPDGALYLADMYRLWVEHPKFLPPEIAAKLDWRAGDDRGRIYRILPAGAKPRRFEPPRSAEQMVALLADRNGWRQFLGQRLLVESDAQAMAPEIRRLLQHDDATTRLHAIWTLDGLSSLEEVDVIQASVDPHVEVRIAAIRLSQPRLHIPEVLEAVVAADDDPDIRVRFEVALALSGSELPAATESLGKLAVRDGRDPAFADGLLTSTRNRSGAILAALIASPSFRSQGDAGGIALVKRIAAVIGARGEKKELVDLLELVSTGQDEDRAASGGDWWRAAAISGLGQGLPRYRGEAGRLSLPQLLTAPPPAVQDSVVQLKQVFDASQRIALDRGQGVANRAAAVELLAYQPLAQVAAPLTELLASDQPVEVQAASIDALSTHGSEAAARMVLECWSELGPAVRGAALNLLLRRADSTRLALDAMAAGRMNAAALSLDQRVQLLKHPDESLRAQAAKLFGGAVSSNRQQVAKDYEQALSLPPTASRGEQVFTRVCAACHRVDGKGHEAGPDLSDVRNRSKPALLYDILDPNSKVEPRFTAYSVLTVDGAVFQGLIESETSEAVVLKMAEGKQKTIGRAEIEQIKVSNVSLMPEGIEKDVTPQQMADLLDYLKGK